SRTGPASLPDWQMMWMPCEDNRNESSACRDAVRQKSDCDVTSAQSLSHDARSDNRGQEQHRSQRLGRELPSESHRGLDARMKALIKRPSISDAIASTSMP